MIRTPIFPSISSRVIPRLFSYLSFVFSSVLFGSWGLGRQDVVLFESPPLFLVLSGLFLGRVTNARVVMNVSDIWPDILVRMGHAKGGPFLKAMEWLERFGYRHADVVALTNPGAASQIKSRFPDVTTTIISNGVDTNFFRPDLKSHKVRSSFGANPDDFLIGYCGLHGLAQGLDVVLGAAERLQDNPRIKFIMIGDGPVKQNLLKKAKDKGLRNISFVGRRPKGEMPAIVASCDLNLVPLVCHLPGTMPSKVYESLASGTPPLVTKKCEGDTLVTRFDAGRTFEPLDDYQLANIISELFDNKKEYGQICENAIALSKRFDRDLIAARTEEILEAVSAGTPLPEIDW